MPNSNEEILRFVNKWIIANDILKIVYFLSKYRCGHQFIRFILKNVFNLYSKSHLRIRSFVIIFIRTYGP